MAADKSLAARIRDALARTANVEERMLFGCACYFLDGNVLAGVWKDALIARVGPGELEQDVWFVAGHDESPIRSSTTTEPPKHLEQFIGSSPFARHVCSVHW